MTWKSRNLPPEPSYKPTIEERYYNQIELRLIRIIIRGGRVRRFFYLREIYVGK